MRLRRGGRGRRRAHRHRHGLRGREHRPRRRQHHLRDQQRRQQGHRGLRLRESGDAFTRIVTEKENIGPGTSLRPDRVAEAGHLRGRLQARPDGRRHPHSRSRSPAQGEAVGRPAGRRRPSPHYRAYVQQQADALVPLVDEFVAAVKAGDVEKAKALYAPSRVPWEAVEPVAESFGDLDPRVDLREADLEAGQEWTGWHRIEKALWTDGDLDRAWRRSPTSSPPTSASCSEQVPTAEMSVASIGNGAKELLDEVATGKITGEEEAFSHTDLVDFQANLDGAKKALRRAPPAGRRTTTCSTDARRRVHRRAGRARRAPRRRPLRLLRHGRPRPAAPRAGPRRRRPRRAAVAADGGAPCDATDRRPQPPAPARGCRRARRCRRRPARRRRRARQPATAARTAAPGRVPRRAPGRHRHAGAGSPALRVVRRHDHRPGRARRAAPGLDRRGPRDDRRPAGRRRRRRAAGWRRRPTPARRVGLRRREPHPHRRLRAVAVRRPVRARRRSARRRWPTCRRSPATRSTPPAAAATSRSRPAPTTRRSRCTPSAT